MITRWVSTRTESMSRSDQVIVGQSLKGKGSPEQIEATLEAAVEDGVIHEHFDLDPTVGLTAEQIQEWSIDRVGWIVVGSLQT